MSKLTLVLACAAVALSGGAAYAQRDSEGGPQADMASDMTWAQFKERADKRFDRMDANHNGVIDQSDRDAMKARMAEMHPDGAPAGDGGEHRGHGGMGGMGGMRMADADHDGTITRAEYDASVKARFDMMDANHDGVISAAEREAARDKMRAMREARMGHDAGAGHGPDHGPDAGPPPGDAPPPPDDDAPPPPPPGN